MIVINVKMGAQNQKLNWAVQKKLDFLHAWICELRFILDAWSDPSYGSPLPLNITPLSHLKSPSVVWFLFPTSLMSHHLQQSAHLPAILNSSYVPEVPVMVSHFCVCSFSFLCLECPYTMRPPWASYRLLKISSNMRPTNDPGWIRVSPSNAVCPPL